MAKPACVLFLLDWRPVFWSTREEYYRQLCCALTARGTIPVLTVSESPGADVLARLQQSGAHVIVRSYHAHPWTYWSHIRSLARQYSVRLVHVRFFDYFTAVFWLCRWSGIRNILFTEANSGEWEPRGWRAHLIRMRTSIMCAPLTKAIAISAFIRNRLTNVGIPENRTCVIHNGVDLSQFHADSASRETVRMAAGAGPESIVLIFASALLAWKRPAVALRVCAEVAARGLDVRLLIAGDGPLQPALEAMAQDLGIASRVSFLGHQRELARWYSSADLFIHTALGEAFGNVLVEAMACGLPVIATASGSVPELVTDRETGLLVSTGPREIEELTNAVQGLMSDRQVYGNMSEAAVRQAARFPIETSVKKALELYEPFLRS